MSAFPYEAYEEGPHRRVEDWHRLLGSSPQVILEDSPACTSADFYRDMPQLSREEDGEAPAIAAVVFKEYSEYGKPAANSPDPHMRIIALKWSMTTSLHDGIWFALEENAKKDVRPNTETIIRAVTGRHVDAIITEDLGLTTHGDVELLNTVMQLGAGFLQDNESDLHFQAYRNPQASEANSKTLLTLRSDGQAGKPRTYIEGRVWSWNLHS